MKTLEYYEERAELYANDIWERYGIQREKSGKRFIYTPFPTREESIESFVTDLDEIFEELEDFEELTMEEDKKLVEEASKIVAAAWDRVAAIRKEFAGEEEYD